MPEKVNRVSVKKAAELLEMSILSVQAGMQCGALPIGACWIAKGSKQYTYHISAAKLADYLGIRKEDIVGEKGSDK